MTAEVTRPGRSLLLVFAAAVLLYLPTIRFGYVQDDRAIVVANPAAHSAGAALRAFDEPYWPRPSEAGLYRPLSILTLALDWSLSGGSPAWPHVTNALWHGLASILVVLVLARWLPLLPALAAGLLFAVHPVHVEGVANIVSRNDLLATVGMLGAVLTARRRWWVPALVCAVCAMLSKEHAIVVTALIWLDDWLRPSDARPYPLWFYGVLGGLTLAYAAVWLKIGSAGAADVAAPFLGAGIWERLAMAFPAIWHSAGLLLFPLSLSADYSPQVIPYRTTISLVGVLGVIVALALVLGAIAVRRRVPGLCFAALASALVALPTSNLLFPAGIVLAERNLYLPVLLPAAMLGVGLAWALQRWERPRVALPLAVLLGLLAALTLFRLPAWRDNRSFLLTLLVDHPESYRAQQSAAAVLSGMGQSADALAAYARADSLFGGDPYLKANYAYYLIGQGDTTKAGPLVREARRRLPHERVGLRADYLLARARGRSAQALAIADTAQRWFPFERDWYRTTSVGGGR